MEFSKSSASRLSTMLSATGGSPESASRQMAATLAW